MRKRVKVRFVRRAEPMTIRLSVRATIRMERLLSLEENEGRSRTALLEEGIRLLANRSKIGEVTEDEITDWIEQHTEEDAN